MKTLLLDADGVFVDFISGYLNEVEFLIGIRYCHEDVAEFKVEEALGLHEHTCNHLAAFIRTPAWCMGLKPIPGALEAIQMLIGMSDVYIVTTPWKHSPTWAYERQQWIQKHLGLGDKVVSTSQKHLVRGDIFVDDRTENVIKWQQANPNGVAVLWSQPWNERDDWDGERTNDWNRIMELVSDA